MNTNFKTALFGGFDREDVFRCLKTGLGGITPDECDILENYALKWEIRGAMWTRETPWSAHPDGYGEEWTDEARARLKTVNALRERVQGPFARLKKGVGGSGEAEQKVRALYGYLEEIKLPEVLQTQTEQLFAAGEAQRAEQQRQHGAFQNVAAVGIIERDAVAGEYALDRTCVGVEITRRDGDLAVTIALLTH